MDKPLIKRAAVFAHFDRDNIIDEYVLYYLRSLKEVCDHLVLVSTSDLPEHEISKARGICDQVVVRENVGYDFMSYKAGLERLEAGLYDEIVLCNDSVYGPLVSLSGIFEEMQQQDCDFWGITENNDRAYHIQSYFLVFRKDLLRTRHFKDFWDNLTIKNTKQEVIDDYEVGLSQFFIGKGFRAKAYSIYMPTYSEIITLGLRGLLRKIFRREASFSMLRQRIPDFFNPVSFSKKINPTHSFWRQLIKEEGMPFIKVALLRDDPSNMKTGDYDEFIGSLSEYNTDHIKKHLERMSSNTRHEKKKGLR